MAALECQRKIRKLFLLPNSAGAATDLTCVVRLCSKGDGLIEKYPDAQVWELRVFQPQRATP
jgi:hypothetical protein